ncbi:MAG: DUF560 domain-containing protein [Hyphomicrobiales bacterium]|nr:DUF560 domain-containing protein [Hyphomicrobiales bacterium]
MITRVSTIFALALAIVSAALPVASARAAITPAIEGRASLLIKQGRAPQALQLLRRYHNPASRSPQHWFILGIAAYRAGDLAAAEMAFRRVLILRPGSQRAKLELARVLHQRGDNSSSERLFRDVRSQNPPAQVAANIDRFLAMMQDRNKTGHAYRVRATVGVGYDSNVNQATKEQTVILFGLPFLLGRDARQRGAGFGFFKGELDHIYRFNRHFAWATSVSFTAKRHFGQNDYDSFVVTAASGPVLQPGERTTIMLPVFVNLTRYENTALRSDRRFYSNDFGIAPQLRYALTKNLFFNVTTVISRRHYFETTARRASVFKGVAGFDITTARAGTFSAGLSIGRELARLSIYSNRSRGFRLGWQYAFATHFVVSLYATYDDIRYDARQAIYSATRRDQKTTTGLDAIYKSEALKGDILLSYMRVWNRSNLAIFRYERDLFSVGYRKTF